MTDDVAAFAAAANSSPTAKLNGLEDLDLKDFFANKPWSEKRLRTAQDTLKKILDLANAGIEGDVKNLEDYDIDKFDQVMAVNVKGPFLGLKASIPVLTDRGGGSFIITSSIAGLSGAPQIGAYATSKHAVIGLMKSAAKECADKNIRVNTVNPSPVETRMMRSLEEGLMPGESEQAKDLMESNIPLGRYGKPEDVAKVMLFLASDDSSFVTGSVYTVDGGSTA